MASVTLKARRLFEVIVVRIVEKSNHSCNNVLDARQFDTARRNAQKIIGKDTKRSVKIFFKTGFDIQNLTLIFKM